MRNLAYSMGRPESQVVVDEVTEEHVARLKVVTLKEKRNSPVTWNTDRRHLIALFNLAVRLRWIQLNPVTLVGPAPVMQRKAKAIDRDSFAAYIDFLKAARKVGRYGREVEALPPQWFWLALLETLYCTGMRISQLVGLNWADVDIANRKITLRAETSKTRREWDVPISSRLEPHLRLLLGETTTSRRRAPMPWEQVFCLPLFSAWQANFVGGRMKRDNVVNFFRRLVAAVPASMPTLSAHRVRHTTATMLANNPKIKNLKVVQQLLGHTSITTTLGYVHVNLAELSEATELL
jgi:integrase